MRIFVYETTERETLLQLLQQFKGLDLSSPLLDALLNALLQQNAELVLREAEAVVTSHDNATRVTDYSIGYVSFDDMADNEVCLSVADKENPALFRLHVDYGESKQSLDHIITLLAGIMFCSQPSDTVLLGWESKEDPQIETTAIDAMGILYALRRSI